MKEGVYNFELLKRYPTVRKFMVKKPMKQSFADVFFELFAKR